MSNEVSKWEQFNYLTELYKSYLSIMVNLGVFSFAAIGGVSSFIFSTKEPELIVRWSILMPLGVSIGLAVLYAVSIRAATELKDALSILGAELEIALSPHAYLLVYGVALLAVLYSLITVGLATAAYFLLFPPG